MNDDSNVKSAEHSQFQSTYLHKRDTSQFSRLEVLIQQMNSQSSTLAGLMGG